MSCDEARYYYAGNIVSIVAAAVIAFLLIEAYLNGYEGLFRRPLILGMASLAVLGVVAAYFYSKSSSELEHTIRKRAPLVILLAFIGVAIGYFSPLVGGAFIVAAYFLEASIALPLYKFSRGYSGLGALLFILGVLLFTVTLPLVVLSRRAALLPLLGDLIKTSGLFALAGASLTHAC